MKFTNILKIAATMLFSASLTTFLEARHSAVFDHEYEKCKKDLIARHAYDSQETAFKCVRNSVQLQVLGTLLFREGSILEKL